MKIIDIVMKEILAKVSDRKFDISMTEGAKDFIAKKGFDPISGARPLKRAIQKYIEDPLAEEILKGKVPDGAHIRIKLRNDKLAFSVKGEEEVELKD